VAKIRLTMKLPEYRRDVDLYPMSDPDKGVKQGLSALGHFGGAALCFIAMLALLAFAIFR